MFGFTGDEVTLFRCLGEVGSWSSGWVGWGLVPCLTSTRLPCSIALTRT